MKITPEHVQSVISHAQFHRFTGTTVTVCCITLKNGHTVVGQSACADPEEFNGDLGQQLAYEDAKNKIYGLEAYLLSEALFQESRETNEEAETNERSTDVKHPLSPFEEVLSDLFTYGKGMYETSFPEIDPDLLDVPCNIEVDEGLPENVIEIHVHHHGASS